MSHASQPAETVPTVNAAFQAADALAEARAALVRATLDEAQTAYALTVHRALVETRVIEQAGGDKALGANEEARKRALTIALDQNAIWQSASSDARAAERDRRMAEVEAKAHGDRLAILLEALGAGITEIPAALLTAGLADDLAWDLSETVQVHPQ